MDELQSLNTKEDIDKASRQFAEQQVQQTMQGVSSDAQARRDQYEADQLTTAGRIGVSLNTTNTVFRSGLRLGVEAGTALLPDEPNFDAQKELDANIDNIHPSLWSRAAKSDSSIEFNTIMELSQDQEHQRKLASNMGAAGVLPNVLTALVDVDSMFLFLSGGSYLGPKMAAAATAATLGRSSRAASIAYGAGAGLEAASVSELGNRALGMGYEGQDLPMVMASGLVFGGSLGAVTRLELNASKRTQEILNNTKMKRFEAFKDTGAALDDSGLLERASIIERTGAKIAFASAATKAETSFVPAIDAAGSAGAAKINATYGRQYSEVTGDLSRDAEAKLERMGYDLNSGTTFLARTKAEKIIDTIEDTINTVLPWLKTDMDRMMLSKSPTAMLLSMQTMEAASGKYRGINRTAAVEKSIWQDKLSRNIAVSNDAYKGWQKANKKPMSKQSRYDFDRAVIAEMDSRYIDGIKGTDPHVNMYADAMDADFADALKLMQDSGVHGADAVTHKSGWMPQRWSSRKYFDMIDRGVAAEQIELGLMDGYAAIHPNWSRAALKTTAKAVISRAKSMAEGLDTNVYRVLQQDGRAALGELYMRNGMSKADWETFADLLEADLANRGKAKILKARNEIDPRTQIPGTEYRIRDLMEENMVLTNSLYARSASGTSALANSAGIRSRADWATIKDTIKNELQVNGGKLTGDAAKDDKFLENLYTQFAGGAMNGEVNAMVRRAIQISNLGLLNQMGLTQVAEAGVIVAANGWEAFVEASHAWLAMRKDPTAMKKWLNEAEQMGVPIHGEHNLSRSDLFLDDIQYSNIRDLQKAASKDVELANFIDEWIKDGGKLDDLLGKGQRLQGYLSGFYAVRHAQHMMQDRSFLQAIGKHINGSKKFSSARLKDMGFTPDNIKDIQDAWKHVEYDGKVITALNIDQWNPNAVKELSAIMARVRHQNVQRAMIGENMFWTTSEVGQLMANLRTFTLLGMKKQTLRHARIADAKSVAAVLYGVPFAGTVYAARQMLNGKDENLTPEKIVKGALGYSNVTAPIGMITDPLSAMMGMDALQLNQFGSRDFQGQFEAIPSIPAFDSLNRLGRLPSSVWSIATGDARPADISSVQAIPIFGNMMGFNAIFNGWKDQVRSDRAIEKATAKKSSLSAKKLDNTPAKPKKKETVKAPIVKEENINPLNALDKL